MTSVSGIGSKQRYVGVPLSIDKKPEKKYEKVPFECHRCHQVVDSEKGYFVEHYRVKVDRYNSATKVMCAASNNKVRAELREVNLDGECEQCGTRVELHLKEDFPGSLKQYGGFIDTPCTVCDGKKHATCEECGKNLVEIESVDNTLGVPVTTTAWVHDTPDEQKPECDNAGEQWFVYDMDQQNANGTYVAIAGPFPDENAADLEQTNLENAPTASGNENYGTASEVVGGTTAKAFALSIKQNPACNVRVHDGFTIEERDDSEPEPTFDPTDPASIAAALSGTDAQEG